ncbi:MAG: EMC3/TMCO1 family protein [Nitrososphaera sp.]|jgi:uncharacterized membrane protein (DUF106 family)
MIPDLGALIGQIFGQTTYTSHPLFPDFLTAVLAAISISIGMNFGFAFLRKKTTDIEKMNRVMKETTEWRKQYTDAIKKQDKPRIEELKKKQAYVNKLTLETQQQSMRPMLIYFIPSLLVWFYVFPNIFGAVVALSPVQLPFVTCTQADVAKHAQLDAHGKPGSPCTEVNEMYLWGMFFVTSFAFNGVVAKITKTGMPSPI